MRAAAIFVAVAAVLAGCGGDDSASPSATVVDRTGPVPEEVRAFLDRVGDEHELAFDATYHVLKKLGGTEHTVAVHAASAAVAVEVDGAPVNAGDDAALSEFGIFSGFMTAGPARAIEAAARRADAEPATFSSQRVLGVDVDCIEIPIGDVSTSRWCLHPIGVFASVDTPAVSYELTELSSV